MSASALTTTAAALLVAGSFFKCLVHWFELGLATWHLIFEYLVWGVLIVQYVLGFWASLQVVLAFGFLVFSSEFFPLAWWGVLADLCDPDIAAIWLESIFIRRGV
jgi:hypothetical protein